MTKRPKWKDLSHDSVGWRLGYAMEQRGMRAIDMCDKAADIDDKIGSSTISQYLSGTYIPKQDRIHTLACILSVPDLWLMGISPEWDMAGASLRDLENPMEAELLNNFRKLNVTGKELIMRLLRVTVETKEYKA